MNNFGKDINEATKALKEALNKLPTKEASEMNAYFEDIMNIATDKSELTDLEAEEKRKELKFLSDKIISRYGVDINK